MPAKDEAQARAEAEAVCSRKVSSGANLTLATLRAAPKPAEHWRAEGTICMIFTTSTVFPK